MANEVETFQIDLSPVTKLIHDDVAKLGENIDMYYNRTAKLFEKVPDGAVSPDKAAMEETIPGAIKKSTSQLVPVAVGGFGAIVVSEVVDGIMVAQKPMVRGLTKAGLAVAVYAYGKKIPLMSGAGKNIMAALLAFDALRDITPISTWASQVANKISGAIPVGGLADQRGRDVLDQAKTIANDYSSATAGMGGK